MKVKNFRIECDRDVDVALHFIRYCAYDLEEKVQLNKDKVSADQIVLVQKYVDVLNRLFHEEI